MNLTLRLLGRALLIVTVLAAVAVAACTESESSGRGAAPAAQAAQPAPDQEEDSWGLTVAALDGGGFSEDDPDSIRANFLLNALAPRCGEDAEGMADNAVTTRRILRNDYGVVVTLAEVLEGLNDVTVGGTNFDCVELLIAFVILRGQ